MEEDIKIVKKTLNKMKKNNFIIQYKDLYIEEQFVNTLENILNELERLQKESNDLRAIKETVRYLEEAGVKDDLYYVVGRGSYLADVLNSAFNDYIPKRVIRDKMQELEKELKEYDLGEYCLYEDSIQEKIKIYKELLGE